MTAIGNAARRKMEIHAVVLTPAPSKPSGAKAPGNVSACGIENQCGENVARGQDGQRSRSKDGGLGVEQGGGDQIADKHDGVDHRNERIDSPNANVADRQDQEEGEPTAGRRSRC